MIIDKNKILEISSLLRGELPGLKAHQLMAPYQRKTAKDVLEEELNHRLSSTLMLLYPRNNEWFFALMKRPDYDGVHGGQVSFPGGKREPNETPEINALRETEEEIGISRNEVKILGKLTDVYIPPSKMLVNPFVGMLENEPIFYPDSREVEKVLEVPLIDLYKEEVIKRKKITVGKHEKQPFVIEVPCYELNLHTVWGATALMLCEFMMLTTDTFRK